MAATEFTGPFRIGVARIGRSGTKLHPVSEMVFCRADGSEVKYMNFRCTCTGTNNGRAHNSAQVFWGANVHATCGNTPTQRAARAARAAA